MEAKIIQRGIFNQDDDRKLNAYFMEYETLRDELKSVFGHQLQLFTIIVSALGVIYGIIFANKIYDLILLIPIIIFPLALKYKYKSIAVEKINKYLNEVVEEKINNIINKTQNIEPNPKIVFGWQKYWDDKKYNRYAILYDKISNQLLLIAIPFVIAWVYSMIIILTRYAAYNLNWFLDEKWTEYQTNLTINSTIELPINVSRISTISILPTWMHISFIAFSIVVLGFFYLNGIKLDKELEENTNMVSRRTNKILNIIIVGAVIGFGILLIILGYYKYLQNDGTSMIAFVSVGVSIIGLGIAVESLYLGHRSIKISEESTVIANKSNEIAKESKHIAEQSDEKMTSISSVHFIGIIDNFIKYHRECYFLEGDTLEIYQKRNKIYNWATDFRKANQLVQWASEDYQSTISHVFVEILKNIPWDKNLIINGDVRHLLTMCKDFFVFKYNEEDYKNLISILNNKVSNINDKEEHGHFINRLIEQLNPRLDENNINKPFVKM